MNRTSQMTANISIATGCSDIHSDADRGNTKSVSIVKKWLSSFFPAFNKNMRRETAMLYSRFWPENFQFYIFYTTSISPPKKHSRKIITNIIYFIYYLQNKIVKIKILSANSYTLQFDIFIFLMNIISKELTYRFYFRYIGIFVLI